MAIPLSDHDIEALLYICTYGLTRRSSNQQGTKIDSWMLSSLGFNHCIVSLDLRNILIRVSMGIFNDDDLFHLRIFNAICCCHYQFSVGYGRPVAIDSSYADLHKLILQFPTATVGDAIKVAELELYELLAKESGQDSAGDDSYYESSTSSPILSFSSLTEWRSSWEKIISKDITQGLNLSYYFSHIMKGRRIIQEKGHQDDPTLPLAYNTACQYSFEIINRLLELPESSVRGTPSFHLSQIVYACATLFDFLDTMKPTERKMSLNLISKVYWHLNKSGEQINVATDTIARLIRKLVELASNHQPMEYKQTVGFVGTGSITEQYIRKRHIKRRDSQQQRRLSVEDLPGLAKGGRVPIKESPEPFSTTPSSDVEFQLPDVSNFENFEDFFYDIFKPEQAGL
ncbi:DEKNAAC104783 [Brettanomyces naardenensis]|uniref:DEKNAAC104783 n=1 Tax=Brettanomyces naardenensis TaxID=13370 RepID=A0A448YRT2_BRENA|nr:DEKNAAC104783 [Brettanomyces naardenensis]